MCSNGIANMLWRESMKMGKRQGYQYVTSDCTAKTSTHIAEKVYKRYLFCTYINQASLWKTYFTIFQNGMSTVFAFPLDRMIVNNNQIWPNKLSDGTTAINLVVGDLNEIVLD